MNFDAKDKLRDHDRLLADIIRQLQYIPSRLPTIINPRLIQETASALILPGESGLVVGVTPNPINATGHPVWAASTIWLDPAQRFIVQSNSATIITGDWDGSGSKSLVASYSIKDNGGPGGPGIAASKSYYEDAGVNDTNFLIYDPLGLLPDVTAAKPGVHFSTGAISGTGALTVLATEAGGSGGGDTWVGWPGPDPTTGVAPGRIFKAKVNDATHVVGADATFAFDSGESLGFGTHAASGTCNNSFSRAFLDNEDILILGGSDGSFYAIKLSPNIMWATTDGGAGVSVADTEFDIDVDGAVSIVGAIPGAGTADVIGVNVEQGPGVGARAQFAPAQWLPVAMGDDGKWRPLVLYDHAWFKVTSAITAGSTGASPSLTLGNGQGTLLKRTGVGTYTVTGGIASITLYNLAPFSIPVDAYVHAVLTDGLWVVDLQRCTLPT